MVTIWPRSNATPRRDSSFASQVSAHRRPAHRFVPVKTAEQQTALMLVGLRERLIRNRTQLANAIRGYAAEFGLVAAKGVDKIELLLARIAGAPGVPELAKDLFAAHGAEYAE